MAQQSLYRRYRPRRFAEVRGQDHVITALRNAVATGTEGHAYLFSGPRGTGKTSTARILAKALNCEAPTDGEPCGECEACRAMDAGRSFDLFELDAASNNGVEAVRELVERTAVGSPGRTKVYILDEVHMLTAAASNALLKTLEEPPEHVRFVLATTDPQKVLPTIRSRTQHFEFRLLSAAELEDYVRWVVADAGLDVDDEAVAHVVRQGRGSARDTLSALDQVVAAGGVLVRSEPVEQLFAALAARDTGAAIVAVADALGAGHDPRVLAEAFLSSIRDAFLLSLGVDVSHLVDEDRTRLGGWAESLGTPALTAAMAALGSALVEMRQAADPRVPLEVALVQLTAAPADSGAHSAATPAPSPADTAGLEALTARVAALEEAAAARPAPRRSEQTEPVERPEPREPAARPDRPDKAERPAPSDAAAPAPARPTPPPPPPRPRATDRKAPPPPPRRTAASTPARAASAPARAASSPAPPAKAPSEQGRVAAAVPEPAPDAPPDSGPAPAAADGGLPDRDALVMAFGDSVVPHLKGMAKALFTTGRFVAVADGAAVFALDNAPTRDRAEKYRPEVEKMLGTHFGRSVPLRLIVETEAARYGGESAERRGQPGGGARAPRPAAAPAEKATEATGATDAADDEEADMVIDLDELEDAPDQAVTSMDRLTAAFPGAELVELDEKAAP